MINVLTLEKNMNQEKDPYAHIIPKHKRSRVVILQLPSILAREQHEGRRKRGPTKKEPQTKTPHSLLFYIC